jgi:hypothetical protein
MDIQQVLRHQIITTRFKDVTSPVNKKDILATVFKQVKQKQNIFNSIIDQPMDSESLLQAEVDDYVISLEDMSIEQLDAQFERLMIEDRSFQTESNEKLKQHWGL